MPDLEFHQLDLRYERLRIRRPRREGRLLSSLAVAGQQVAIVVVQPDEERYVVIDGFKRVRALRQLGSDTIAAVTWDLPEEEALALSHLMAAGLEDTALEQGWLLWEMRLRFSLSQEDLALRFDRSVSWVSRRLALVKELPGSVQDRLRLGELPAHAAGKYLVPLARAKREDCERLVLGIAGRALSTRDVGRLYRAYRESDREQREALLESPLLYLRVSASSTGDKAALSLQRDVADLLAICRRARSTLRTATAAQWPPQVADKLFHDLARVLREIRQLKNKLEKEIADVGPWPTVGNPGTCASGAIDPGNCSDNEDLAQGGQACDSLGSGGGAACRPDRESA